MYFTYTPSALNGGETLLQGYRKNILPSHFENFWGKWFFGKNIWMRITEESTWYHLTLLIHTNIRVSIETTIVLPHSDVTEEDSSFYIQYVVISDSKSPTYFDNLNKK